MPPPFLGRSEQASALEGLTPTPRGVTATLQQHSSRDQPWTATQRKAALVLAGRAIDRQDLSRLLDMCGLLPPD